MGYMLVSGFTYFVTQSILQPLLAAVAEMLGRFAGLAEQQARLPWVGGVEAVTTTAAVSLMALAFAWKIFQGWVAAPDGSGAGVTAELVVPLIKAATWMAAGGYVAYHAFAWGVALMQAILAAPLLDNVHLVQGTVTYIGSLGSISVGVVLFLALWCVVITLGMVAFLIKFAIYAVELVFFQVSAPLVALGWIADPKGGGVWAGWWRSLLVMVANLAVMAVSLKGMLMSAQMFDVGSLVVAAHHTTVYCTPVQMGRFGPIDCTPPPASLAGGQPGGGGIAQLPFDLLAWLFIVLAWIWVGLIRGPHMVHEWAYHSGIGGGVQTVVGAFVTRRVGGGGGSGT